MNRPICTLLVAAASFPLAAPRSAAQIQFQSGTTQTTLLELYTSEGCSSCPPAETWLSRQKEAPGLWKDFVPVAFHVDYWNDLGWRDPWSNSQFSDRQRNYAQAWSSDSIYTPEFILNGAEWPNWRRSKNVPTTAAKVGTLTVVLTNNHRWEATFQPVAPLNQCEIHAAYLLSGLTSNVKLGENRGRHLTHDFVTATLTKQLLRKRGDTFQGTVEIKPPKQSFKGRMGIAVWVTSAGHHTPLQATGGWLPADAGRNASEH